MNASLQYFPADILKTIFSYFNSSLKTLARLTSVCKRWNELVTPIMNDLISELYSIDKSNLELFKRKQRIRPIVLHNLENRIKCKKTKIEFNMYLDRSGENVFTPSNRGFFSYFIAQKLHIIALNKLEVIDLETGERESVQLVAPSSVAYPPDLPLTEYSFNSLILTHRSETLLTTDLIHFQEKFLSIFDKQKKNLTFICERDIFLDAWDKYVIVYRNKQIEVIDRATKQIHYSKSFPGLCSHALHRNTLIITDNYN